MTDYSMPLDLALIVAALALILYTLGWAIGYRSGKRDAVAYIRGDDRRRGFPEHAAEFERGKPF